jgi:phage RecT family recombinase
MSELKDKLDAATSTALARRGGDVYSIFQDELVVKQLVGITGAQDFVKRMLMVAANELRNSEALAECTRASFLAALMHAAHLRLEVGGALGHFYLVPFKNTRLGIREVVPILGYRGIIVLARRSRELSSIAARAVYSNDFFEWEYGLEDKLVHRPKLDGERGNIVAFYGVARFTNGGVQPLVMSRAEVDKFRKRAKASESGPWVTDYEAMGCKTVVRRMEPFLPLTNEAAGAIQEDEAAEREGRMPRLFEVGDMMPPPPAPEPVTASKRRAKAATSEGASATGDAPTQDTAAAEARGAVAEEPTVGEAPPSDAPVACKICGATGIDHDTVKHEQWAVDQRKAKGADQGKLL